MNPMSDNINPIEEVDYGVYVWRVEGAGLLANENLDLLRINSMRGDLKRMAQIRSAAASYGYPDGEPVFIAGKRAISDSEYEEQMARNDAGMLADPYDIPALVDKMKAARDNGK